MSVVVDWASPPGETIARVMNAREIPADELADAMDLSADDFEALLDGTRRVTTKLAERLARELGSTARFWLARDKSYVLDLARLGKTESVSNVAWARSMPTASMRAFGWISRNSSTGDRLAAELLAFFDCDTLREWGSRYSSGIGAVAFRTSLAFPSDDMATLVWLRAGEKLVEGQTVAPYDAQRFGTILPGFRKLSAFKNPSSFVGRLTAACNEVGVRLATVRAPKGCRASGASWFGADGRPVILLSFRHLSEDHFWFTFFHEAAHVLLHGGEHIDGETAEPMSDESEQREHEANEFARDIVLPARLREELCRNGRPSTRSVVRTARIADVTPGIVVGQLERDGTVPHGNLSFLKRRYRWSDDPNVPVLAGQPRKRT